MITRKTYNCVEGEASVTDAALAYVKKLLRVERTDKVMNIVVGSDLISPDIDSTQVLYLRWSGGLAFSIPFNNGEKIKVVYEN